MANWRRRRPVSLRDSCCARVWCRPLFCMRRQFALIVVVAVVMAVASAMLGSYTWGIAAPGLSGRRAVSGGAFHLAVTVAQAVLWWRFTEGAQLSPVMWIAYALFGGLARGGLRVWTIWESDSETAAAAIQASQVASRPMELLAYRCFYAFVLVWQVLVSSAMPRDPVPRGEESAGACRLARARLRVSCRVAATSPVSAPPSGEPSGKVRSS